MDEERVVNLKSEVPYLKSVKVRIFQSDSVVMKWNTFNGGDTAPSSIHAYEI
jgi:hypothetical protein